MIGAAHPGGGEPPRLERVLLPAQHEFEVTIPDGSVVHGYVTSYEVWDSFVRVNLTFIDHPLRRGHDDVPVLRLADGTFAKMVHGNGGGSDRFSVRGTSFARPLGAQTAIIGLGRDRPRPAVPGAGSDPGGALVPARDRHEEMVFTPIMELQLP